MSLGAEVQYYTLDDFELAKDVTFYGKTFRIVGCDLFTEVGFVVRGCPLIFYVVTGTELLARCAQEAIKTLQPRRSHPC